MTITSDSALRSKLVDKELEMKERQAMIRLPLLIANFKVV